MKGIGNMDIDLLTRQFVKGVEYFRCHFAAGTATPPVLRQLAEFERSVVAPFDSACAAARKTERERIWEEITQCV